MTTAIETKKKHTKASLTKHLSMIETWDELVALPDYSIIVCEIEEYTGKYVLVKESVTWGDIYGDNPHRPQWFTFIAWSETGEIEIVDDFTPELPALLISEGVSMDCDEDE